MNFNSPVCARNAKDRLMGEENAHEPILILTV